MQNLSRVLALFVAVMSLSFVGFAIATYFGGPDWQAITQEPYFQGYKIVQSPGDPPLWTATRGPQSDEERVAQSRVLPEVIAAVLSDIRQRNQQQLQELNQRRPQLQARIELLNTTLERDRQALARFEETQRARLAQLREQQEQVAGQVISATSEAQKLENIIVARREDIFRLEQQVAELNTDFFRLQQIQKQLQNQLDQLAGDRQRADRRYQDLMTRVNADQ